MLLSIKRYLTGPYSLGEGPAIHEPVPQKWLPGDIIDPETMKVVKRGAHKEIVGIVDFLNRTGMGFNARNVPLYLFHPLDPKYPPMIVSSKVKHGTNKIATGAIEHWNDKWPRAGLASILGDVGDPRTEKKALLLRTRAPTHLDTASIMPSASTHETVEWDAAFNIDPEGCEDVDDVLCWRKTDEGYEAAIAIADVAAWIPEGSDMDAIALEAGQTLYDEGAVVRPMLPTILSTLSASLRADGVARPALAYCFTVEYGQVVARTWRRIMLPVQRAYTYESVLSEDVICLMVPRLLRALFGAPVGDDPHRWIEVAMIAYNTAAASVLRSAGVGVLRAHAGRGNAEWDALATATGCSALAFLGASSGSYVRGDQVDCGHAGLGLDVYCHASSPLRRYADLANQRWLHHLLFGAPRPATDTDVRHLNERASVAKAYERDMWFLAHLRTDAITTVSGFVLSCDGVEASVYVPDWRRKIRGVCYSSADIVYVLQAGDRVTVRAYTDLRRCSWSNRIVCSVCIA